MPRKKTPPPTNSTLNAVVAALAKENARLKEQLELIQADLTDTIDRMMDEQRKNNKVQTALMTELAGLRREIDAKAPAGSDPMWFVNRLRTMRTQLQRMRQEGQELLAQVEELEGKKAAAAGQKGDKEEQIA